MFEPRQKHPWVSRWSSFDQQRRGVDEPSAEAVIDWHPRHLPELVHRLYKVTSVQLSDLRCALYGHGNYTLTDRAVYDVFRGVSPYFAVFRVFTRTNLVGSLRRLDFRRKKCSNGTY